MSLLLIALIGTLADIAMLRKGPEEIPHSWIVLFMSMALWLFALLATSVLIASFGAEEAWVNIGSAVFGAICYLLVLTAAGFTHRAIQTLSALIGIGGLITFTVLAELILFTPVLGPEISGLIARVTLMWSIPVKGHIIARAINWHWYAGIVISLSIFVLQLALTQSMSPEA